MQKQFSILVGLLLTLVLAVSWAGSTQVAEAQPSVEQMQQVLQSDPLMFIENVGQFVEDARFQVRGSDRTIWLAEDTIWITILEPAATEARSDHRDGLQLEAGMEDSSRQGVNIRLSFVGANPAATLEAFAPLETTISYFIGNDPAGWRPDVPVWDTVRYVDLYPGLDLELSGSQAIRPRLVCRVADCVTELANVTLQVEGAEELIAEEAGLSIATTAGNFSLPWLEIVDAAGRPMDIRGADPAVTTDLVQRPFISRSAVQSTGSHPTGSDLFYSTFLGGGSSDRGNAITVDGAGNVFITGVTLSTDFPTTPGAFDTTSSGSATDGFVTKLNAANSALLYSTFLGGTGWDSGSSIAIDSAGIAFITGDTISPSFPTTPGAFDTTFGGIRDGFVAKLDATGSSLLYSTFLGDESSDYGNDIAVDGAGNAFVTGTTYSTGFPITPGAIDNTHNGTSDAFVTKLNATGSSLLYSTFLGSEGNDESHNIVVNQTGNAFITGVTWSTDFPTTSGAFDTTHNGDGDVFVTNLNAAGSSLLYSTFLGGTAYDSGSGIAIDGTGNVFIVGGTNSSNFPTTPGAFDTTPNSVFGETFAAKLNAVGGSLLYSTFLGGEGTDWGHDITVDGTGSALLVGQTSSPNFPITPGALDTTHNGDTDVFVSKLNETGSSLLYSTFLGGGNADQGNAIAVDGAGNAFVTGVTTSTDFPTTLGGFDTSYNGDGDAFVAGLALNGDPQPNFTITQIEVTQATQTITNSVPLIAGKPTFIRVYVDCGPGCASLPGVTGIVRGFDANGELAGSPLQPINAPITAYHGNWPNSRGNLSRSLNFAVPPEWTSGTVTFTSQVIGKELSLTTTFQPVAPLSVHYVPIRYSGEIPSSAIETAHLFSQQVMPIHKIEYRPAPPLDWDLCLKCPEWVKHAKMLMNQLRVRSYLLSGFVYGWLPPNTFGRGIAPGPTVAFSDEYIDGKDHGPRIFAHEIGHLLGRQHTNTVANLDDPANCRINPDGATDEQKAYVDTNSDWDFPTSKIQDYGLDGLGAGWLLSAPSAVKEPAFAYDYMSYCGFIDKGNVWTSPWTYERIYEGWETLSTAQSRLESTTYFIASGLVFDDDTAILDPVWLVEATTSGWAPHPGTTYCVEAQDVNSVPLTSQCFDLSFTDYESGQPTEVDGFNLMLPYPPDTARIVLTKGDQELAAQTRSSNAPSVNVLSPNGSENLTSTGVYTITWSGSDIDGDPLTYSVFYSPNGIDWLAVGGIITTTQLTVNAADLPGGNNARVRVVVTDGHNTSTDVSDEPFSVGRKVPRAMILYPESGGSIPPNTPLWLQGYGFDLEDGLLGDSLLFWSSSRDGNLGIGEQILTTLSKGDHVITLTVMDSDGNTVQVTKRIFVGYRIYLPTILHK